MSVDIQIRKFHNQFKNGVDLDTNAAVSTHYLLGFVGQKMKRVTRIATFWRSESSDDNIFNTISGQDTITRQSGSWLDDGFQVGDTIDWQPFADIDTVINLTDLVMTIAGTFSTTSAANVGIMYGTTKLRGVNYFSNFVENNDPPGYVSGVDGINEKKWAGEFTEAEYDALDVISATQTGLEESWKMNSDTVTFQIVTLPILSNSYTQTVEVVEVFTITPFFDNIANLEAGIKPDEYASTNSLRSIAKFELLHTLLNPITKHILDDSDIPDSFGNVGYYDEHANGFTPVEFTKDAIAYTNTSGDDQIVIDEVTSIVCSINSANNVLSQGNSQFQMNIVFLNEDIDNFENIDTNFVFDTVFAVADGSTKSGENNIFSNVEGNIISDKLVVTADITFTPTQQILIEDGKYIISIATNDHALAIDSSIFVNVNMDIDTFIKNNDIPDLMAIDTNLFYEHPHDKGTQGKTDFQGWVEDGILMSTDFTLDLSKNAVINSVNVRLMARNSVTNEDFEITSIPLDFASAIISGGVQQINIDSERGFKLVQDSQFNFVKVQTMAKVGDLQHYDIDIGFKLQWMDWQALADADPVFFDNAEINDNLNRLISNYSALNDYDIVMFIDAEVDNGDVNTSYRFISPALRTYEYDIDDSGDPSTKWSALTETFDQSANNLNANIHGTQNTEIKVTFTALSGFISEVPLYGTMRLEEFQQGGLFNIFELSSFRSAASDNPLIPKAGQSKATFTVLPSSVEVECAIDFTKLNPGSQYKISCRLGTSCDDETGCTWQSVNSGISVLLFGVDFTTETLGLACGDGGAIIKTTNGGDTWASKVSGTSVRLRDIHFASATRAYCCGNSGKLLRSNDAGETWNDKSPVTGSGLFDLHFDSEDVGWVCGQGGRIFKTTDGGDNWVTQTIATSSFLNSIVFFDALIGWTVSSTGQIFTTADGGATWTTQTSGVGALEEIVFVSATLGWAISFVGQVIKTTNAGVLWTEIINLSGLNFRSIDFLDANNGIVAGGGGKIYRTTDGGDTWNLESTGATGDLFDSKVLTAESGIAVGQFGEIVKYECVGGGGGCAILLDGKLKEDGTQKLTEDGDNKILE